MKSLKLSAEERTIERSLDDGKWKTARAHLAKSARVNIRLAPNDLQGLKSKAVQEGMPYQTLIASVLHKFVTGQLASR